MIIQPLVENGIKHGLSPLIEGRKIRVEIRKNVDTLYFTVSDTGVGVADKTTLWYRYRIDKYEVNSRKNVQLYLKITDNFPRGLKFEFEILCKSNNC
jgi:sensor histidine kinase YesM